MRAKLEFDYYVRRAKVNLVEFKRSHDEGTLAKAENFAKLAQVELLMLSDPPSQEQLRVILKACERERRGIAEKDARDIVPLDLTKYQQVQMASVLYQDTKFHMDRAEATLNNIQTMGSAVTTVIVNDALKLNRVTDNLDVIKAEKQIARKRFQQIVREISRYKITLVVALLISLLLLALSIADLVKTIKKKK